MVLEGCFLFLNISYKAKLVQWVISQLYGQTLAIKVFKQIKHSEYTRIMTKVVQVQPTVQNQIQVKNLYTYLNPIPSSSQQVHSPITYPQGRLFDKQLFMCCTGLSMSDSRLDLAGDANCQSNPFMKFVGCLPDYKKEEPKAKFHHLRKKMYSNRGRIVAYKQLFEKPPFTAPTLNQDNNEQQASENISILRKIRSQIQNQMWDLPIRCSIIDRGKPPIAKSKSQLRKLWDSNQERKRVPCRTQQSLEHACKGQQQNLKGVKQDGIISFKRRLKPRRCTSTTKKATPQKTQNNGKNQPVLKISHTTKQLNKIKAESYIVVEYPSGQTILAHRAQMGLEIASLTKIMTFYTVEKICQQLKLDVRDQLVLVGEYFEEYAGTSAEILEGDIYTVEQLLYGLMLPSGNDAAMCLADWAGRHLTHRRLMKENICRFVAEMNNNAKQLRMSSSRFQNPTGLPHPNSRSTAQEVSQLINLYLGQSRLFRDVISSTEYVCNIKTQNNKQRKVRWTNTNKLLRRQGFIGVKTGVTVTAGPCLATCYSISGRTFIVVLLRANKISRRFKETRILLHFCLKKIGGDFAGQDQKRKLSALRKKRRSDSDHSDEQQQFVYSKTGSKQWNKRHQILKDI